MPYGARVGDQLLLSVIDLMPYGYDLLAIISMKSIYFPSLRRLSFIILVTRQPLSYAIYLLFKHSPMILLDSVCGFVYGTILIYLLHPNTRLIHAK